MKNPDNYDQVVVNAIHRQPGKARKHQFTRTRLAARAPFTRKLSERFQSLADRQCDSPRGSSAVVLVEVIADTGEIGDGGFPSVGDAPIQLRVSG